MSRFIFSVFFMSILSSGFSQNELGKGNIQLNAGVGFSSWGLPGYAGFDIGIHEYVTLGAEASFRSYREKWNKLYYRHSVAGISFNGNFHFHGLLELDPVWDFYAGVNAGFFFIDSPDIYPGTISNGYGIAGQIGGRYFFTDALAINLELGGGNVFSGGKLGVTYKL